MATLCKPAIVLPPYKISQDEIIRILASLYAGGERWETIETMIRNTRVENRFMIKPMEEVIALQGFGSRNAIYAEAAKTMSGKAADAALQAAGLDAADINMIIPVTCTGFMMPSIASYLISSKGFGVHTRQLPIAQLGCVAGTSAINRAFEYLSVYPAHNVLILSVEFCSLCFQKDSMGISSLISDAIFGDCVAACVVKGGAAPGYRILATDSYTLKNTEHYIKYDIRDTGFEFVLDKEVMYAIRKVAPIFEAFVAANVGKKVNELDFYMFHTGGRRILDEVMTGLSLPPAALQHSRDCLRHLGNIASAAVLDVLYREFESGKRQPGEYGMMAAFGPGFTTEYNLGIWT
jgi:phloroglucinol synthase